MNSNADPVRSTQIRANSRAALIRLAAFLFLGAIVSGCSSGQSASSRQYLPNVAAAKTATSSANGITSSSGAPLPPADESVLREPADQIETVTIQGKVVKPGTVAPFVSYRRRKLPLGTSGRLHNFTTAPLDDSYADIIVMQPGDVCDPAWPCIEVGYNKLSPTCGGLSWYDETSELFPGITVTLTPVAGPYYLVYATVAVPTSTPVGVYKFTIGATCSNPNATGLVPGPGRFGIVIVTADIIDNTASPPATITNGTLEDGIGREENVSAVIKPAVAAQYMQNFSWVLPDVLYDSYGSPEIQTVAGYTQSNQSASVLSTPLDPTQTTLDYFTVSPYPAGANGQLLFYASSGYAGTAFHATTGYVIDTPTVSVNAIPGLIQIGGVDQSTLAENLIAGNSSGKSDGAGMQFQASWSSNNSDVVGSVGMTQLVSANLQWWYVNGDSVSTSVVGMIDSGPEYPQVNLLTGAVNGPQTVNLQSQSSATWRSLDSPSMPLYACDDLALDYNAFADYFFFQPTPKPNFASIPVTIATGSWSWEGGASKPDSYVNDDEHWTLLSVPQMQPSWTPNGVQLELPEWSGGIAVNSLLAQGLPKC